MFVFRSLSVAGAVLLSSSLSLAQETKPEEIIVTSSALRETPLEIAQSALVLSGDALRRQAASSIGETIANTPGVSATYFGPSASRPVIRGLGGDRVLMLQNGVSALDVSSLSQDHAVSIEAVLADQVEILKGPATLMFGSGAVGGAVNVVDGRIPTRFTRDADRIAMEVRGDTAANEQTAVGRLDLGTDRLRIHVDGFTRENDDVDIPGFAFSRAERAEIAAEGELHDEPLAYGTLRNSASKTHGGALGISVGDENGFVGLSWNRFDTRYGVPASHTHHDGHEEDADHEEEDGDHHHENVRIDMRQDRYDLKAERALSFGAFERVRLRGAYNDYEHRELEGEHVGTVFQQDAVELRLNLDHAEIGGWRGTLGSQYVEMDFAAQGAEAFVPDALTRQVALFVFEKREFGDVALELGARVERQTIDAKADVRDYDETAYSVSAGAVWNFTGDYTATMNLTRSQRHPQSAELYADGPHLAIARYEIGNELLRKETANTLDISLHRHAEHGPHWSLTAFYNDYSDYIFSAATGLSADELPVFGYRQADAEFYGLEGELTIPLYRANGHEFDVRLAADYVRGQLKDGENLPQIPPLRYGVELHYERGPFHFGLQTFRHDAQDKIAEHERSTSAYTMLDADLSYRFAVGRTDLLLFLRGANLLDEDARRHASPLKEIAPLPGRSLHIGLRAEL
jgi:iron complex outermembrane receptor protein